MTDFRALRKFLDPDPIEWGGIKFHFHRPIIADIVKIESYASEDDGDFWFQRMLSGAVKYAVLGDKNETLTEEESHAFVEAVEGIGNPIVDRSLQLCGPSFDIKVRRAHKAIQDLFAKIDAGEAIELKKKPVAPPEDNDSPLG